MSYHVSNKGKPELCPNDELCDIGGAASHYASEENARKAFALSLAATNPKPKVKQFASVSVQDGIVALTRDSHGRLPTDKRKLRSVSAENLPKVVELIERWNYLVTAHVGVGLEQPWYADARKKKERSHQTKMANTRRKLLENGVDFS